MSVFPGLMNAYRSVRSAVGSFEISGASRWLDAFAFFAALGVSAAAPIANAATPVIAAAVTAVLRIFCLPPLPGRRPLVVCDHIRCRREFGSLLRAVHISRTVRKTGRHR